MMDVKLVVTRGKKTGERVSVPGPKFFIGRAEDCHLRPGSEQISRYHCAILVEGGTVLVRDLGSKNGTFVNGERIGAERELKTGDRLEIGPLEFEVQLTVGVGGKKKSKVHSIQEAAARTVQSAADDDVDLSELLGQEDTIPNHIPVRDTQPLNLPQAGKPAAGPTTAMPSTPAPQPPASEKKQTRPGKPSGQVPGGPKSVPADSQQAASEVLRKMLHRR